MKNEIVLFEAKDGKVSLPVQMNDETVWLTQAQMAQLFNKDRTVIGRHIRNAIADGEIDAKTMCAKFAHMGKDADQTYWTEVYNGTFAVEDLPVYAFMATIALFVGPLFFAAGLFGHGGSPIVFPVALISYVVYIALLRKAVCTNNPLTRYTCLSIITICAFIGWQGVRYSI